jgi:tetratricopeptide (TPR) repeat protein
MVMPLTLAMIILRGQGLKMGNSGKAVFACLIMLFALQFICLVMAQYSVTILVFVIGLFIFFGLLGFYLKRRSTLVLSILSILVIALAAVILIGQLLMPAGGALPDGRQDIPASAAEQVGLSTLGTRVAIWKCATDAFINPAAVRIAGDCYTSSRWLTGYGPETFVVVSQGTFPPELKSLYTSISLLLAQPENHYLYLLITTGVLGLVSFLCLLVIFFFVGFRLISRARERYTVIMCAAIIAAVIQYCAHVIFDPSQLVPEMVFWLMLAIMAAMVRLEGWQQSNSRLSMQKPSDGREGATGRAGNIRKSAAVLTVLLFLAAGAAMFFPAYYANMKIKQSLNQNNDPDHAMALMTDAIALEPDEAYYRGLLGYYAYSHAITEKDESEMARLLTVSTASYESCTRLEPYLAYWRITLADNYLYRARHGYPGGVDDAVNSYKEADALFPQNSVILNKLALALIQKGDYRNAERILTQSEGADSKWVQTTYCEGLLDIYRGRNSTMEGSFVSVIRDDLRNLNPFLGFCKQLSLYGGINKISEGLRGYAVTRGDDWLGFALLGIADVYGDNVQDGNSAFSSAVGSVDRDNAVLLSRIISVMAEENQNFRTSATDLQARLAGMTQE